METSPKDNKIDAKATTEILNHLYFSPKNAYIEHAKTWEVDEKYLITGVEEVRVLILYTGGTFGMCKDGDMGYKPKKKYLLKKLQSNSTFYDKDYTENNEVPGTSCTPATLNGTRIRYHLEEYKHLIDSSELRVNVYKKIAKSIETHYDFYDSFLIIYGTDTMAYMASQLSFMLENLGKTVVVTGSQIPISEWRNDAETNLVGALQTCQYKLNEVVIFFRGKLFRGNRTIKKSSVMLEAFESPNYLQLATFDAFLTLNDSLLLEPPAEDKKLNVFYDLEQDISLIYMNPLMTKAIFKNCFMRVKEDNEAIAKCCESCSCKCTTMQKEYVYTKAVIIQAYGMGNFPMETDDFKEIVFEALDRGTIVVLVSQCRNGYVNSVYSSSVELKNKGAILAEDMTLEATLAKLSYVLGKGHASQSDVKKQMLTNMRGEISTNTDICFKEYPYISKLILKNKAAAVNALCKYLNMCSQEESIKPSLHKAVENNSKDLVEHLINTGIDINQVDSDGNSALFYACLYGYKDIAQLMFFEGAKVISPQETVDETLEALTKDNSLMSLKLFERAGIRTKGAK